MTVDSPAIMFVNHYSYTLTLTIRCGHKKRAGWGHQVKHLAWRFDIRQPQSLRIDYLLRRNLVRFKSLRTMPGRLVLVESPGSVE